MRGNKLFKYIDKYAGVTGLFLLAKIFRKKMSQDLVKYRWERILLIKLSAMGDTILMVPAIRALRQAYPQAVIKIIVTSINREVLADCPYVDEIIDLDLEHTVKNPLLFWRFIKKLRKEKFDLSVDFDQWLRLSPLLAFFSGAEQRVGFRTPGQHRDLIYTRKIGHARDKHEVECFLDLVAALGIEPEDKKLELWVKRSAVITVNRNLASLGITKEDIIIGLHPGCGSHGHPRQWPADKYISLIKELQQQKRVKVVITGGNAERELVEYISAGAGEANPLCVVGWPLAELIALVRKYKVLVCGNTGVMHIAAALQTPVVALHGPTDPRKWGPWTDNSTVITAKKPCVPCLYLGHEYGCRDFSCMDTITVDEVRQAVLKYL